MKKSLYPKTKRVNNKSNRIIITEKLDGSNIGFFNFNDDLLIATRNNVVKWSEKETHEGILYKGMKWWLDIYAEGLLNTLHPNSGFFGEWVGIGVLKYNDLDRRVYMFAKANLNEDMDSKNIYYNPELFKYPFVEQEIPDFIGVVPIVTEVTEYPTISFLDGLYSGYSEEVGRNVEGFVINNNNDIKKYVRMKNGKLAPHKS